MALTIGSISNRSDIPASVGEITKDATQYEFDALVPLKYWLRTAATMSRQAQVYMQENDDEMTYFLLFRHAHLVLSNLATHPEYNKNDPKIKALSNEVKHNLKALELLKDRINQRHDEYIQMQEARQERRQRAVAEREQIQLQSREHPELAATLAGQEFSKRTPRQTRLGTRQNDKDDLAVRMQAIRDRIEPGKALQPESPSELAEQRQRYIAANTGYSYPKVPVKRQNEPATRVSQPGPAAFEFQTSEQVPSVPPKHDLSSLPPPRPDKLTPPARPGKVEAESVHTFAPAAYLENGTPLRTIFVPPTLRTTFLRLAYQNTTKNIETCGFLAGTLRANALFASALIVPKQTATSDTCEMTDESELFDYVDQHDLMVLGWIHTHPTQTCFMSSRDLHTHSGYQMMLAESIAIVCAPSKGDTTHGGDWGVYRLTDPPGKMTILQCDKPGIFHPHDVENIYTDAMRPGHVMEITGMDFEVVDLR